MADIASHPAASPLSLKNGEASLPSTSLEQVLLAMSLWGTLTSLLLHKMNKALEVFLAEESHVSDLISSGLILDGAFVRVSLLAFPSTLVIISLRSSPMNFWSASYGALVS